MTNTCIICNKKFRNGDNFKRNYCSHECRLEGRRIISRKAKKSTREKKLPPKVSFREYYKLKTGATVRE